MYCLEMRSTEDWNDVRYRDYTTSERKADLFKEKVSKIQFTDSGHGVVATVKECRSRREPNISMCADHVRQCLKS